MDEVSCSWPAAFFRLRPGERFVQLVKAKSTCFRGNADWSLLYSYSIPYKFIVSNKESEEGGQLKIMRIGSSGLKQIPMTIGLFIDGSFVYKCFRGNIDYLKLRNYLEEDLGDSIDEAYFFNSDDDPPKATRFNNYLTLPPPNGPGFRIKIYWLSRKRLFWPASMGGGPVIHPEDQSIQFELTQQKGVDVGLAYHMVRSYYKRNWTKLVLCAGDGDFHEPVQNLVEHENVDLYLVGALDAISTELKPYARRIYEIDKDPLLRLLRK